MRKEILYYSKLVNALLKVLYINPDEGRNYASCSSAGVKESEGKFKCAYDDNNGSCGRKYLELPKELTDRTHLRYTMCSDSKIYGFAKVKSMYLAHYYRHRIKEFSVQTQ